MAVTISQDQKLDWYIKSTVTKDIEYITVFPFFSKSDLDPQNKIRLKIAII